MLLSKDPRDLTTTEACLTLVLLTEAEASGSNLILSPPPTHSHLVSVIFLKHLLSPVFFSMPLLPGAAAVPVSCAADLPRSSGRAGRSGPSGPGAPIS